MENRSNHNEEMPKAQSMKAMDKKHNFLVYAGMVCLILGVIFNETDLGFTLILVSLVCNGIGLYRTFKYRKLTKIDSPSSQQKK